MEKKKKQTSMYRWAYLGKRGMEIVKRSCVVPQRSDSLMERQVKVKEAFKKKTYLKTKNKKTQLAFMWK